VRGLPVGVQLVAGPGRESLLYWAGISPGVFRDLRIETFSV